MKLLDTLKFNKSNKYVQNVIVLMSDSIIKILVGFIFSIFIARYFGPGKFGSINLVVAYISLLQVIEMFGFDDFVLRDLGIGVCPEQDIIRTIVVVRLSLALIIYCLGAFFFYFFFDKSLLPVFFVMGLQLFCYSFYILKQWYQIKSLNKYSVISSQITLVFVSICKVMLIIQGSGVFEYAVILVLSTVLEISVLYIFYVKNKKTECKGNVNLDYAKSLFKSSLPILLQGIAITIYMKIGLLMIGKMLSVHEIGIYSIGSTISELVYFIPLAIVNAFYPKIIEMKNKNEDYESLIVKIGQLNVILCALYALFCTFLMPFLITTVYGAEYKNAGSVIQILSWASIFVGLGCSHACLLLFENTQRYSLYATVSGAIISIFCNYFLISILGIYGVALSTVISQAFSSYLFFAFVKGSRTFKLRSRSLFFLRR